MKNVFRLVIVLFAMSSMMNCGGCGDVCPPDKKVGDLKLGDKTLGFISYTGGERLVFRSSDGDSLVLQTDMGEEESLEKVCVKRICTEPKYDGNSTCEYYESEAKRYVFRGSDDNAVADILFYSEVIRPETEKFFQAMNFSFTYDTIFAFGGLITEVVPDEPYDRGDITSILRFFEPVGNVSLNGVVFHDCYELVDGQTTVYYQKERGFVGFIFKGKEWALD